jgi:transcriptional regulator with XRE-family HTH domain
VGKGKRHAAENRALVGMLRSAREDGGITQQDLAERLGKRQSFVSKVERGERLLDPVELRWWCGELGLDTSEFVREWERRLR